MEYARTWRARRARFLHRRCARKAARQAVVTRFVTSPEPRTIGHFARGRQLIAGNFLLGGTFTQAPQSKIWDIAPDNPDVVHEAHGGDWMDDLAAVADGRARAIANDWVMDWIARFGDGSGPGWTPALTGRRLTRWIYHGAFILRGQNEDVASRFFQSLGQQAIFLDQSWPSMAPGRARFEALTGTIIAGLALENFDHIVAPAVTALSQDCANHIDAQGGVPTRNPEHLLDIFTLVTWASQSLSDAGQSPPLDLHDALRRMAPTLRALRHVDGGLARFHGGGRGIEGRLDHVLADSKVRMVQTDPDTLQMGFARITAGRTSLILDAAAPPSGATSVDAHASTLAFEVTSGRRPLIVNCGSGRSFGPVWRRSGRTTAAHSTLSMAGYSSSRLAPLVRDHAKTDRLLSVPATVHCAFSQLEDGRRLELSHDGYVPQLGLTHARVIDIANDGRSIVGEDYIAAISEKDKNLFRKISQKDKNAARFKAAFHLHPDVDARVDLGGSAVSLILKSGEVWIFRHDGTATLTLEPSTYMETGRTKPRDAQQVVLSGESLDYASRIRWSLAKAQDTPDSVRDISFDDPADSYRSPQRETS